MAGTTHSRVLDIINFLTSRPTESFTLSDIATHLNMSNGSAHRVLNLLTDEGYLNRHPKHKTYSLGLVLISVGQATFARHPVVRIAQREMEVLSGRLGVQSIASAIAGGDLLFIAKAGSSATPQAATRVGLRRPFMPPLGLIHLAWSAPEQLNDYWIRFENLLQPEHVEWIQRALESIRQRGYSMSVQNDALAEITRMFAEFGGECRDEHFWNGVSQAFSGLRQEEMQLLQLDNLDKQRVSHISAPVFDSESRVVLEVSLTGLPPALPASDISYYIEQLMATTAAITHESHGVQPYV